MSRKEIIGCDVCGAMHDVQYVLPDSWIAVLQTGQETQHFCRDECLAIWLQNRGNAIAPRLVPSEKPQEQPACKARRFLLVDEAANITEGVKWSNGSVTMEGASPETYSVYYTWEALKSTNPGSGVQWIDQEVAE